MHPKKSTLIWSECRTVDKRYTFHITCPFLDASGESVIQHLRFIYNQNIMTHIVIAGTLRAAGTDECNPEILLTQIVFCSPVTV